MDLADNYAICILAVSFAIMGIGALLKPELVTTQFGISILSSAGRNEVRAVYGGFGIFMACALAVATIRPEMRSGICFTVAAALLGMAAGRLLSAFVDRKFDNWPKFYCALEIILAAMIATEI